MTTPKLELAICKALGSRRDIWLSNTVDVYADDGSPTLQGVQLRRLQEREVRGADSYHPYTYVGWKYYGQSFAIETEMVKSRSPLDKDQLRWRGDYEAAGGLYIEAWSLENVFEELGRQEPKPWSEYEIRSTRII